MKIILQILKSIIVSLLQDVISQNISFYNLMIVGVSFLFKNFKCNALIKCNCYIKIHILSLKLLYHEALFIYLLLLLRSVENLYYWYVKILVNNHTVGAKFVIIYVSLTVLSSKDCYIWRICNIDRNISSLPVCLSQSGKGKKIENFH